MPDQDLTPSKTSRFPWAAAALFAGLSAGLLGSPWFETAVRGLLPASLQSPMPTSDAKLAALKARMTAFEDRPAAALPTDISARLAALEASRQVGAAGAAAVASDLGPLSARVDAIDTRLTGAEQAAHAATTAAALIPGLQAQVQTNTNTMTDQTRQMRLLASLAPLRRQLDSGQPLGVYYDVVSSALGGSNADVAALRAVQSGGPTLGMLQHQLVALTPQLTEDNATAASSAHSNVPSWLSGPLSGLSSLVQVKRTGAPAQQPALNGLLTLAVQRAHSGDVASAATIMRKLPASAQNRASLWLIAADKYVAAHAAMARIDSKALEAAAATVGVPAKTE